MQNKIDDLEKSMKRSNDKQLKLEHELCEKVGHLLQPTSVLLNLSVSSLA